MRRIVLLMAVVLACAGPSASGAKRAPAVDVAAHGKRIQIMCGKSPVTVLYLRGTGYEVGFAHGALCRDEVRYMSRTVTPLLIKAIHSTPAEVDAVWTRYSRYLRPEFREELRGLADGSGVSLREIWRSHAVPDMSEWHCTFFAANKFATRNRELVQVRALDYETEIGLQKYPAIIVTSPSSGIPFANVGWLGWCGLVTGMNAQGVAMSEIGDSWDRNTDTFSARPLTYVMRETVQFGGSLKEALHLVKQLPRTTSLLYCLSSAHDDDFRALATSHRQCRVFQPWNLPFQTQTGLVYMSMGMGSDWNKKVGDWLLAEFGTIDQVAARRMMKELKTGNLHAVVYQPGTLDMWVANASDRQMAYDRPFLRFNLGKALQNPFFAKP